LTDKPGNGQLVLTRGQLDELISACKSVPHRGAYWDVLLSAMPPEVGNPTEKKRKTYTIKKEREIWTEEEHTKFLEALEKFGKDWKKIEAFIGTKTLIQIRSHAQKHFSKQNESLPASEAPPPKQKRKYELRSEDASDVFLIPWVSTPDALSDKTYLSSPDEFAEWMKSNGLLPDHPPPGIDADHLLEIIKQQKEFLHTALKSIQNALFLERPEGNQQGLPDWSKIYYYLGLLFESDTFGTDVSRQATLGPAERSIIDYFWKNLMINISDDNFSNEFRLLLKEYETKQLNLKRLHTDKV